MDRNTRGEFFFPSMDRRTALQMTHDRTGGSPVGTVLRYTPHGRFEKRIGHIGRAPGAFQYPDMIRVGPGDTLLVWDAVLSRLSTFSPEGEFVRTAPIHFADKPIPVVFVPVSQGRVLVMLEPPHEHHFLLLDSHGRRVRAFGDRSKEPPRAGGGRSASYLSAVQSGEDRFFALRADEYRIDEWTYDGQHLRSLSRKTDWLEPPAVVSDARSRRPPRPIMRSLAGLPGGLLAVTVIRPSAAWKPLSPGATGVSAYREWNATYITTIEVIDPASGKLLATLERGGGGGFLTWGRLILRPRERGEILYDVFEIRFSR